MKTALISGITGVTGVTGVTGQDGSYLCEFLLDKGCKMPGIKRRASSNSVPTGSR